MSDVFLAAKAGNLKKVQEFVEQNPSVVNERWWDATPLYYAALCGHYEICEFLLECGSNCAEDTFDGDRCLYGALNDDIRRLLKRYAQRRTFVLGPLESAVTKMWNEARLVDLVVHVNRTSTFHCHRFVLAARVPFFRRRLRKGGEWYGLERVWLDEAEYLNQTTFQVLLRYCYSDVLDCPIDHVSEFLKVCKLFQLQDLRSYIIRELKFKKSRAKVKQLNRALDKGGKTQNPTVIQLYPLGRERMPTEFGKAFLLFDDLSDFELECQDGEKIKIHKCLVCGRSDYFATLLSPSTQESFNRAWQLDAPYRVVYACILFLYSNGIGVPDVLFSASTTDDEKRTLYIALIDLATQYMLSDMVTFVVECLESENLITLENILDWLQLAEIYHTSSLETACFRFMGHSITKDVIRGVKNPSEFSCLPYITSYLEQHETKKNFCIAEVREAFIESDDFPVFMDIATRDTITDEFEKLLNYTGN